MQEPLPFDMGPYNHLRLSQAASGLGLIASSGFISRFTQGRGLRDLAAALQHQPWQNSKFLLRTFLTPSAFLFVISVQVPLPEQVDC